MRDEVWVREVGPRDGLQMLPEVMPTAVKIKWIAALVDAGVREIEVGSFVPPSLLPQMADTPEVVRASAGLSGLCATALAPNLKGVQRAAEAGAHGVIIPVSVSESHSQANTHRSTAMAIEEVRRIVDWVQIHAPALNVEVGCATAFGCSFVGHVPERRVVEVAEAAVGAGARSIVLADTVGYANPREIKRRVQSVRSAIGDRLVGLHLHDTYGLGLANVFAGLEVGVRRFDASLAGLGGCPYAPGAAGNIATEDLVFMLEELGFDTGIDLARLLKARRRLEGSVDGKHLRGHLAGAGLPVTRARAE